MSTLSFCDINCNETCMLAYLYMDKSIFDEEDLKDKNSRLSQYWKTESILGDEQLGIKLMNKLKSRQLHDEYDPYIATGKYKEVNFWIDSLYDNKSLIIGGPDKKRCSKSLDVEGLIKEIKKLL